MTEFTFKSLNAFQHLQILFLQSLIFNHFNLKQQLYIDLNVLKEFSFDVHVYYVKSRKSLINNFMTDTATIKSDLTLSANCNTFISLFDQKNVKLIFFLNYLLTNIKTQYWLIKLKVTDIVWIIKKIHHMIKTAEKTTIIYTDHFITVFIVC